MKPMKLTSLMVMLLVGFSAAAQEEFFDDVYFSSSKKDKKEKTEEKVIQPKEDAERTTMTSTYSTSKRKSAVSDEERDVDEYNRRYTSVDVEEPYDEDSDGEVLAEYNDDMDNEKQSLPILKRNVVRIRNIPSVSSVTIRRARLRLPEQTKSICI